MIRFSREFFRGGAGVLIVCALLCGNLFGVTWDELRDEDKAALQALKDSTGFAEWFNSGGWPGGRDSFSIHGVSAAKINPEDEKFAVTSLRLAGNKLTGTIPEALGDLSELTVLELNRNFLSGQLPASLAKLKKLTKLSLGGNKLSGAIPVEFGDLSELEFLWLDFNEFSGAIPPTLAKLQNLRELGLGENNLTEGHGVVSQLVALEKFWLHDNSFSGSLPDLSALPNLNFVNLRGNYLEGSIPSSYGERPNLEVLLLDNNRLTGSIPATLGNLTNLRDLDLSSNELTGTIPSSLGNLTNLTFFFLQENELSGTIPGSLGGLNNVLRFWLNDNNLEGAIPAALGSMAKVDSIQLQNNFLFGSLPASLADPPNLFLLDVSFNHLEDVSAVKEMSNPDLTVRVNNNDVPAAIVADVRAHFLENRNVRAVGLTPQNSVVRPTEASITLYRPHPLVGYTAESFEAGKQNQDAPLIPATAPESLRKGTAIDGGLVADGVTPLVFRISATDLLLAQLGEGESRTYRLQSERKGGGFFNPFDVFVLGDGSWRRSSGQITLSRDTPDIWGYIAAVRPDDVFLDEGSTEVGLELKVLDNENRIFGSRTFALRKTIIALVHGYNTPGGWGEGFRFWLSRTRPEDFVVTVTYGVGSGPIAQDYPNTRKRLDELASILDAELFLTLEPYRSRWAFTRYDVVCHSQGGVLTRMLSVEKPNAFVDEPYQNQFNAFRGRFHRVITIGSPHNGARLLRYLLKLNENHLAAKVIPVFVARAMVLSNTAQQKFDPFGEQIRALNDPAGMWIPDPDARFHLVRSTTNFGLPPTRAFSTLADKVLGLATEVGVDVLPKGSDAVVDYDSMVARGPGQPAPTNAFTLSPTLQISHSGPTILFDSVSGQTEDLSIAQHVRRALDQQPTEDENVTFGPFVMPTRLTEDIRKKIDDAAAGFFIVEEANIVLKIITTYLPTSVDGNNAYTGFEIEATEIPGKPPVGEITWFAEAYTAGGVTTEGLLVRPIEGTRVVRVEVNDNLEGDIVLYGIYSTGDKELTISSPFRVKSSDPEGTVLSAIEIQPDGIALEVGERIKPALFEIYDDGTRLERFVTAGDITVTSSAPAVLDVSDPLYWTGLANGSAEVTVRYGGLETKVGLTVGDTPNGSPYDAWLASFFEAAQLNDESITGVHRRSRPGRRSQWRRVRCWAQSHLRRNRGRRRGLCRSLARLQHCKRSW